MGPRAVAPLGGLALLFGGCAAGAASQAHAAAASSPRLVLVDVDADPLQLGGNPGALFELDERGGSAKLLFTSRDLADPVDLLGEPDGSLLVVDLCRLGGEGRLWRVAPDGKSARRVAEDAPLVDPTAIARAPDGSIWVVDRGERFDKAAGAAGPGAVFRLSADLSRCEVIASGPPLVSPSDVCFRAGHAWVLDADAYRHDIADLSEGALFEIDASVPAGATGRVSTVAQLHLVSPLSLASLPQDAKDGGLFLIADANTDPRHERKLFGGIYQLDDHGVVSFLLQDPGWRDPCCVTRFHELTLVVDGSSDPLGLGDDPLGLGFGGKGRGGVYAVDLATKTAKLFCASPDFVNPSRLRVVP
jgi:hypothetical protein